MTSAAILKELEIKQYLPIDGISDRLIHPLILKELVVLINVDELGLCLSKPTTKQQCRPA